MIIITLDLVKHKGNEVLLLKFPYNNQLIAITKQLPNATWSNTHKAWYTSGTIETVHQIKKLFADVAIIDAQLLKEKVAKAKNAAPNIKDFVLSEEAKNGIEKFKKWMRSRRYSDSTQHSGDHTPTAQKFKFLRHRTFFAPLKKRGVLAIPHCSTFPSPHKNQPHDQRLVKELQSPTHPTNMLKFYIR